MVWFLMKDEDVRSLFNIPEGQSQSSSISVKYPRKQKINIELLRTLSRQKFGQQNEKKHA